MHPSQISVPSYNYPDTKPTMGRGAHGNGQSKQNPLSKVSSMLTSTGSTSARTVRCLGALERRVPFAS